MILSGNTDQNHNETLKMLIVLIIYLFIYLTKNIIYICSYFESCTISIGYKNLLINLIACIFFVIFTAFMCRNQKQFYKE